MCDWHLGYRSWLIDGLTGAICPIEVRLATASARQADGRHACYLRIIVRNVIE